jgi:hypothetical protein
MEMKLIYRVILYIIINISMNAIVAVGIYHLGKYVDNVIWNVYYIWIPFAIISGFVDLTKISIDWRRK